MNFLLWCATAVYLPEFAVEHPKCSNRLLSATCPVESVLPIRPRPDFCVVLRVMQEGLNTGVVVRRPGGGLKEPTFSGHDDRADLANSLEGSEKEWLC